MPAEQHRPDTAAGAPPARAGGGVAIVEAMVEDVSAADARRIALSAQGFGRPRPARVGTRQLHVLVERLGLLQLDSVNVFERSHYLPVFARLGPYDKADLDRLTFSRQARYTEYWAHVASLIPTRTWPLWRWRMAEMRAASEQRPDSWIHANRAMLDWLRAELAAKGPLRASDIEHEANTRRGSWFEWSDVKIGLWHLFAWGEVVAAGRRNFERIYGLAEHVLPADVLAVDVPRDEAIGQLLLAAARASGIGTVNDLADYYRIPKLVAGPALKALAEAGELIPVAVDGWTAGAKPVLAYRHRDASRPRRVDAAALLSPFDPVVWERSRTERLFGFHYRIEIYVPEPKRIFGYYTLPVLLDEALVGRIDLKSDRQKGTLRVQSAWREADAPAGVEGRIAGLVREAAAWQDLERIEVVGRGDLALPLAGALGVATIEPVTR